MKALVIGGTRFVGLRLVQRLVREGYDVTVLNRGKTPAALPSVVRRLYADRRNPDEVRQALQGQEFEVVFDITGYQVRNLQPMVDLLAGRIAHYIFQSTGAVYAPSEIVPVREDFPYITPENAPAGEVTYALEKVECEQYLLRMFTEKGFPATVFRSPVIYGPDNWMDDREGSYFFRLLQGRKVLVPGNGATIIHYAHVDDVAQAYLAAIGNKNVLGQAYNIASDEAVTIDGYIDAMARAVDRPAEKVYLEPHSVHGLQRPIFFFRWDRSSFYDVSQAKRDFGYQPVFNMDEGMKQTYQWWRENRGVDDIKFIPGKLGHDVDLAYEDDVLARYG